MAKQVQTYNLVDWFIDPRSHDNYRAIAGWFIDHGYTNADKRTRLPQDIKTGVIQTARFIGKRKVKGQWVDSERPGFVRYVSPLGGVTWYYDLNNLGDPRELPPYTLPTWREGLPRIVVDSDAISVGTPNAEPLDEVIRNAKQFMVNAAKRAFLGLYSETEWRVFADAWIAEQDREDD